MLSEIKTLFIFLLSSCDVAALKAGRRRIALACRVFLSKPFVRTLLVVSVVRRSHL